MKTLPKEGVDDMRWQLTKRFCYLNGLDDPKRGKSLQNCNNFPLYNTILLR
jgi:hypothetical protein